MSLIDPKEFVQAWLRERDGMSPSTRGERAGVGELDERFLCALVEAALAEEETAILTKGFTDAEPTKPVSFADVACDPEAAVTGTGNRSGYHGYSHPWLLGRRPFRIVWHWIMCKAFKQHLWDEVYSTGGSPFGLADNYMICTACGEAVALDIETPVDKPGAREGRRREVERELKSFHGWMKLAMLTAIAIAAIVALWPR